MESGSPAALACGWVGTRERRARFGSMNDFPRLPANINDSGAKTALYGTEMRC
jgi:hypothetical protein